MSAPRPPAWDLRRTGRLKRIPVACERIRDLGCRNHCHVRQRTSSVGLANEVRGKQRGSSGTVGTRRWWSRRHERFESAKTWSSTEQVGCASGTALWNRCRGNAKVENFPRRRLHIDCRRGFGISGPKARSGATQTDGGGKCTYVGSRRKGHEVQCSSAVQYMPAYTQYYLTIIVWCGGMCDSQKERERE
jgi:hypothetical protein